MAQPGNSNLVSYEDFVEIFDVIGRYQWLVDSGDAEGWAALWAEDGEFRTGGNSYVGHARLREVPPFIKANWNGKLRHHIGSVVIRYGDTKDEAVAQYYSIITNWSQETPELMNFGLANMRLAREAAGWRIKLNGGNTLRETPESFRNG